MSRRWKYDNRNWARCGHPWCTDCLKKRGRNRGNKRVRGKVRTALRRIVKGETVE